MNERKPQMGVLSSCEWQEGREKGVLRAAYPHTPFSSEYPPKNDAA